MNLYLHILSHACRTALFALTLSSASACNSISHSYLAPLEMDARNSPEKIGTHARRPREWPRWRSGRHADRMASTQLAHSKWSWIPPIVFLCAVPTPVLMRRIIVNSSRGCLGYGCGGGHAFCNDLYCDEEGGTKRKIMMMMIVMV